MNLLLSLTDRPLGFTCLLSARGWSSGWLPVAMGVGLLLTPAALTSSTAVAQDLPTGASTQTQGVNSPVLIVNPVGGDDTNGDGSDRAPFKTITHALQVAQTSAVIQLMPGIYSEETGERFPLQLKSGIVIQGNPQTRGADIVIRGSGWFMSPTFARQSVTILGAKQATLVGVTITNPHPKGYGLWIESTNPTVTDNTFTGNGHDGISVVGNGTPLIRNNYFYQNSANGITIYGVSRPELRENIFEQTGFAININQSATPLIIGNRITQNKDGIVVQAKARPVLRNNSIENNERDGLVAIALARPDLGVVGEPGGNFIYNNGQFDVNAQNTQEPMPAFGNEITKTTGNIDLTGSASTVMPISGTVANQPPAVSTGDQLGTAIAVQPSTPPSSGLTRAEPAPTIVASAIPFGEKLAPSPATARLEPPAASATPPEATASDRLSAASFPVPGDSVGDRKELVVTRPSAPPTAIVASSSEPIAAAPFPFPTALSGKTEPQPRRPIQIMRVASPAIPSPSPNSVAAAEFPVPRPAAAPTAPAIEKPMPVAPPARIYIPPQPKPPVATPVALNSATTTAPSGTVPTSSLKLIAPLPAGTVATTPAIAIRPASTPRVEQPATNGFPIPGALRTAPATNFRASVAEKPVTAAPVVAIEIPVPAPERVSAAPPLRRQPVQPLPVQSPEPARRVAVQPVQPASMGLLPVPNPNVPIGNAGNASGFKVFGNAAANGAYPPVPPDRVSLMGVRYRVVVETADASQATQVKTLVPEAFSTSFQGKTAMQVGAFGDREKANQLMQSLLSQGLRAVVETME